MPSFTVAVLEAMYAIHSPDSSSVIHISLVPKDYVGVSVTGATVYVLFNILVLSFLRVIYF